MSRLRGLSRAVRSSETLRHVRHLATAELVTLVLTTITGLLIARELGPRSYGVLALAMAAPTLVASVLDLRGADTVTRFGRPLLHSTDGRAREAGALIGLCLGYDAIVVVLAGGVALLSHALWPALLSASVGTLLLATVAATTALPLTTLRAVVGAVDRFQDVARTQVATAVLRTAVVLLAVWWRPSVTAVLVALAAVAVVELAWTWALAQACVRQAAQVGIGRPRARDLLKPPSEIKQFTGWNALATVAGGLVKHGDTLVVGGVLGPEPAGYYRLARSMTAPIGAVVGPLQNVVYHRFSARAAQVGTDEFVPLLKRAVGVGLALAAAVLVLLPVTPAAVTLLAGSEYEPAGPLAQIMVVATAVGCAGYWLRPLLLVADRVKGMFWGSVLAGGTSLVACVPVTATWGATGLAWMRLALVSALGHLVMLLIARSVLGGRRVSPGPAP